MATIEIGGIPPQHIQDFLRTLHKAIDLLDDLAQVQATVGTLGMQSRAGKTEEVLVRLANYAGMIDAAQDAINR